MVLGLIIIVGLGIAYYLFSMQFKDMNEVKPDFEIIADDLIKAFQENDSTANTMYSEKTIEVHGTVSDIETADSTINIKMTDQKTGSYIIFSFQKNEEHKKPLLRHLIP